jgi:hypothetical protein
MTDTSTMTDREKIDYLATKVMEWKLEPGAMEWKDANGGHYLVNWWNPDEDWNVWRQVEEKVMEIGGTLLYRYKYAVMLEMEKTMGNNAQMTDMMMKADLHIRVFSLLSAHQSLHP